MTKLEEEMSKNITKLDSFLSSLTATNSNESTSPAAENNEPADDLVEVGTVEQVSGVNSNAAMSVDGLAIDEAKSNR